MALKAITATSSSRPYALSSDWAVLGEFSRRARRVTSHSIPRRGRLGKRLQSQHNLLSNTDQSNLVSRAFSSLKMAVREAPGQGCQSGSKSSLEFHPANTMKCLRFVWITVSDYRKQTGVPDAGNNLRKSHFIMCHVTKYSTIRGVFQQPWPWVSPTAIFKEKKALGTRL